MNYEFMIACLACMGNIPSIPNVSTLAPVRSRAELAPRKEHCGGRVIAAKICWTPTGKM